MKKITAILISAVIIISSLCGCTSAPAEDSGKIKVISTIFPYYDFARAVCGDKAEVSMLVSPASEIHSFDPSPSDMIAIQECDIFLYTGGENDVWIDKILESMDSDVRAIKLMDTVELSEEKLAEGMEHDHDDNHDHNHDHDEISYDDHIWTSPLNAITITEVITDALCEADSENAEIYRTNCKAYTDEIKRVDEEILQITTAAENKTLVFGDRFPMLYFTERYGLDYRAAFEGCSTETDCSAATMAYLIDYIGENDIKAVYTIENSNQNIARALNEQTGAEVLTIQSCQSISKEDFENGETYVSLMERNADALRKGLN